MSRLADINPTHCSACFQQKLGERHVDFDVAWDGPVIPGGTVNYSIDDLVLCEKCLADAGLHVGLGSVEEAEAVRDAALERAGIAEALAESALSKLEVVEGMFRQLGIERSVEDLVKSAPKQPKARGRKPAEKNEEVAA